jgi:hypothetical protein
MMLHADPVPTVPLGAVRTLQNPTKSQAGLKTLRQLKRRPDRTVGSLQPSGT